MDWRAGNFEERGLKMIKYIVPAICLFFAAILFVLGVLEISFPDLSLTSSDSVLDKFPNAWKYGMHAGIAETVLSGLLIIPAWKINKKLTGNILEILVRVGIGGMFIFASVGGGGVSKIADPKSFAVLVAQYQFLPTNLVNLWALILPQFEFWFGLALIVTPFVKECTWVILGMFGAFIIAIVWALFHNLDIACGCFPELSGAPSSKADVWTVLIRDLVLLWPTIWLLTRENKSIIRLFRA
jgi:hypothetical protein